MPYLFDAETIADAPDGFYRCYHPDLGCWGRHGDLSKADIMDQIAHAKTRRSLGKEPILRMPSHYFGPTIQPPNPERIT